MCSTRAAQSAAHNRKRRATSWLCFAADCAEEVLYLFERERPGDDRPRKAIEAARAFARGEITDAARAAAGAAARAAAGDAAWDAAWDAARAAAWDAAGDAAKKALAPTQLELQKSALELVERMIDAA